jgi:hypothetical protein
MFTLPPPRYIKSFRSTMSHPQRRWKSTGAPLPLIGELTLQDYGHAPAKFKALSFCVLGRQLELKLPAVCHAVTFVKAGFYQ